MERDAARKSIDLAGLDAHRLEVWRYLRYLGCEQNLAEDLTQEVFLRAMRATYEHRHADAQAAWLRKIARNLFLQHRRRPVAHSLEDAEAIWVEHRGVGESYVDALRACLARLPERPRRVVQHHYADKLSRREIADRIGMSADGVKSVLRRARELLRACVERRLA